MPVIVLPDALYAAVSQLAIRDGYKTVDDYVTEILRRDVEQRQAQETDRYLRAAVAVGGNLSLLTPDALEQRKREIVLLLLEGLDSGGAAVMTSIEWENIRQDFRERRTQRNKA